MDTCVSDEILKSVAPPSEDTGLSQALADLDSKLAAWSGAINSAQTSIKKMIEDKPKPTVKTALPTVQIKQKKYLPPVEKQETASTADDDEKVLATLDVATAQKIQVLKRLNGNRKSVRELLELYQANSTNKNSAAKICDQSGRKKFWRR